MTAEEAEKYDPLYRYRVMEFRRQDELTLAIDIEMMANYPYKNKATKQEFSTIRVLVPLLDDDGAYIIPGALTQMTAFLATGGISDKNIVERAPDGALVVNWDY
ncbi:hypothetical protein [Tomitella biformata]|uniref:hypothetical protein n=1 Tax=Tomitella biformata TaxID=630403 RepID=UPI0011DD5552|nr:hypothetical protein [Tomitella biformata]